MNNNENLNTPTPMPEQNTNSVPVTPVPVTVEPTGVPEVTNPTPVPTPTPTPTPALEPTPTTEPTPSPSQAPAPTPESGDDEELLKAFIGKNYEKITTKPFNFAGFFFNGLYMFYRKMLGLGLIILLIGSLIITFVKTDNEVTNIIINFGTAIAMGIIVGLFVNKLYVNRAKKKISKIKSENPDKNLEELKGICTKKGGTSIGFIFLGFFTTVAIAIVIGIIIGLLGIATFLNNFMPTSGNNNGDNPTEEEYDFDEGEEEYDFEEEERLYDENAKNDIYTGLLIFDSETNVTNEFTITVPEKFENNSYDSSYSYEYRGTEGIFNNCSIELSVPRSFTNSEYLIRSMAIYHKENEHETSEVTKNTINNIDWYAFSMIDDIGKTYYYATTKKGKVFLFKYEINVDADSDCETYLEKVVNSIESK